MTPVRLRPVQDADRAFLVDLYGSTREQELAPVPWDGATKRAFIEQQFAAQDAHYHLHYTNRTFDIVEVDGIAAGRLYVNRGERDIRIVDITIAPTYRGKGLGTALLQGLLDEGQDTGRSVSIHVERNNPARHLYDRLGFKPAGENGVYILMEKLPAPS